MNCPVCKEKTVAVAVEPGLNVQQCEKHGIWIPALNYWKWIATQQIAYPPEINEGEFEAGEGDAKSGKMCNHCGQILHRYGIGHGVAFHIDQCPKCLGIWLDKGEWEVLKKKNLHNAMHFMFSDPWQDKVRKDEEKAHYEELYRTKLGDKLFEQITEFKKSISGHEQRNLILTYLHNDND